MKAIRIAAMITALTVIGAPAWADTKVDKIRQLLAMIDAGAMMNRIGDAAITQMLPLAQRANPQVPPAAWVVFGQEMRAAFVEAGPAFVEAMVPIYERNYSESEIDDLLAFYDSPTGRKALTLMPVMFEEGRRAGEAMAPMVAQRAAARAIERVRALGYPLK